MAVSRSVLPLSSFPIAYGIPYADGVGCRDSPTRGERARKTAGSDHTPVTLRAQGERVEGSILPMESAEEREVQRGKAPLTGVWGWPSDLILLPPPFWKGARGMVEGLFGSLLRRSTKRVTSGAALRQPHYDFSTLPGIRLPRSLAAAFPRARPGHPQALHPEAARLAGRPGLRLQPVGRPLGRCAAWPPTALR